MNLVFKGRYGYMQNFETLEDLGKKFNVTRERVRQYESDINKTLIKIGKIDRYSLVEFFNKYKSISFHKLFPQLDINFTNTSHSNAGGDITRDRLVAFMESYCGVKENYFKTPERELWHFDSERLKEIFIFTPAGVSTDDFIEIIKDNYGYDDFTSKSALEFMNKKEFIKIVDEKVYPIKINKNEEVAHILLNYPDGLHWKEICKIGNKSYTKNKWDLERIVGDSSINMLSNKYIYLIDRGRYKLFINCSELNRKQKILEAFKNYLLTTNKTQVSMERAYKNIVSSNEFINLNFYDARAIIKKFGSEIGIFHKGTSGTNTISFNQNIRPISLRYKILDIINDSTNEVHFNEIIEQLQKTNEDVPVDQVINDLVDEMMIFRTRPGTYLNFDKALQLCDKAKIQKSLDSELDKYEFVTHAFIREMINEIFLYNLSSYYYSSLSRLLAKENDWYFDINYLSKKKRKEISLEDYIRQNYDLGLSSKDNFENISQKIGMTKINFSSIVYKPDFKFNINFSN
jgi:hypothetical protein